MGLLLVIAIAVAGGYAMGRICSAAGLPWLVAVVLGGMWGWLVSRTASQFL